MADQSLGVPSCQPDAPHSASGEAGWGQWHQETRASLEGTVSTLALGGLVAQGQEGTWSLCAIQALRPGKGSRLSAAGEKPDGEGSWRGFFLLLGGLAALSPCCGPTPS